MAVPVIESKVAAPGSGSVVLAVPSGTMTGNLLLAVVVSVDIPNTITADETGWTELNGGVQLSWDEGPDEGVLTCFVRGSTGRVVNYTFSTGAGDTCLGVLFRISGADMGKTENAVAQTNDQGGTTMTFPAITTTVADTLLLAIGGWWSSIVTLTEPGGYNEEHEAGSGDVSFGVSSKSGGVAGLKAAVTGTLSSGAAHGGRHLAIWPASAGKYISIID